MIRTERAAGRNDTSHWFRSWQAWAAGLVLLYIATAIAGWRHGLIWDEIWLATNAGRPFGAQMELIRNDVAHPPLFYLIVRGWVAVFGGSDTAVKVLPLVINVVTLVAFTILARRATRHWRAATLLFCGIYWQIGSVPNLVRAYGLTCLLLIVAILAWRNWVESGRARWLVGWTAAVTAIAWSHYFGVLLVPAFVVTNMLFGTRPYVFLGAAVVPAVSLVPWALYLLPVYRSATEVRPESLTWITGTGGLSDLVDLAFAFMARTEPGVAPSAPWNVFDDEQVRRVVEVGAVVAHVVLAVLFGAWWQRRRRTGRTADPVAEWLPALLVLFAVPTVSLVLLSKLVAPLFYPRFLIGLLPVYWLVVALAADASPRLGRLFVWGLVAWVTVAAFKASQPSLRPWPVSAAAQEVERRAQPGDVVLTDNTIAASVWWETDRVLHRERDIRVYRARSDGQVPRRELRGNNILPYADLDSIDLAGVDRVWIIHSRRAAYELAADHLMKAGFAAAGQAPVMPRGPTLFERDPRTEAEQGRPHGQ